MRLFQSPVLSLFRSMMTSARRNVAAFAIAAVELRKLSVFAVIGPRVSLAWQARWRHRLSRLATPRVNAFYGVVIYMHWNERDRLVAFDFAPGSLCEQVKTHPLLAA